MLSKSVMLLTLAIGSVASAATFDAAAGFSGSNPSGTWAYGTGATGSSFTPMTVYTASGCDGITGVACWQPPSTVLNVPQITINNTGSAVNFATVTLPTGLLLVHPGQSTDSIVTWTAPAAGTYDIKGFFELLDVAPTGIIGSVYDGSTQIYSTGALTGPPANQGTFTPGGKDAFALTVSVATGSVISFGVNNDGSFLNDSTGFDATITSGTTPTVSPEPASVFLLAAGLFSVFFMSRCCGCTLGGARFVRGPRSLKRS